MANTWASTGGSGVQYLDPVSGRYVDVTSPEGKAITQRAQQTMQKNLQTQISAQQNLANAEVNADAQEYEAQQNREAGNAAFQLAMSQAGGRRAPGGGVARGGYGRRGISINQATGGLSAANARARRTAQQGLASARVAANPEIQQAQQMLDASKASMAPASTIKRR